MRLTILALSLFACDGDEEKKATKAEKTQTEQKSAESKTVDAAKKSDAPAATDQKSDATAAEKSE